MNFNDKLNIAGDLRLVEALSRGAQNHVGDDNLAQAVEAAEQADHHLQEALCAMWQLVIAIPVEERDDAIRALHNRIPNVREAEWEVREVRRAFEKFGLSELLVSAHGTLSPQLAVTRLLTFIAQRNLDIELEGFRTQAADAGE
jgi:hypothetical protein